MTITLRPHQQTAVDAMLKHDKGQVIIPTGGGKTICMIQDYLNRGGHGVTVVVAPRILLAKQLCKEFLEHVNNVAVYHVHSGETEHFSSTKPSLIYNWSYQAYSKQLIFTTYHSLDKIVQSGIVLIRFTLMKHTTPFSVTSLCLLNFTVGTLVVVTFLLQLLNIQSLLGNLG